MIVVELIKMLRRPRTWLIIGMLVALPTLVAILLAITDLGPRPGTGPPFLSAVLNDGTLFPLAALGGRTPAAAADCRSCPRGRRDRRRKSDRHLALISWSAPSGVRICCWPSSPPLSRSCSLRSSSSPQSATPRPPAARASSGYRNGESERLHADPAGAHLANRARTWLRDHLHARRCRGRAVLLHLDAVRDRCGAGHDRPPRRLDRATWPGCGECAHPFLPTRHWLAFVDLFRDPILWRDVLRGLVVQFGYLTVFTLAAWANFGTKDIDD